ncbi:hypothetical protein [Cytobacillus sp. IB215665]|uniref:hypothetical protein n=1 Tax=Cytobacillus sp. IB215665 TaxID=3097357 RepID=UPI002A0E78C8|nr:hypothetical protein [Cytobacillus sp. IB215665]MDX8367860.1 hypothetical protein [Cytobacillus sp. IB215665]
MINYLVAKSGRGHFEIMKLPYGVYLSQLKYFKLIDVLSTKEGQEMYKKEKVLSRKDPDVSRLRNFTGYKGSDG